MAENISDERHELQEDDEKFQSILHEFGTEFCLSDEEDAEDDDDHLLIDLDYENETSEPENDAVRSSFSKSDSITRSFQGSGSHSRSNTAADEESGEVVPRPSLELPSQVDVAEYRADPLKTLHLNRVLQGILEDHISAIKTGLQENKEKQSKLELDVSDSTSKTEKKGIYAGVFRAPFFRHVHSYPPPNEDMVLKKASGDYDIVTPDSVRDLRRFNKSAKLLLRDAVYEDCLKQALKPLVAKMEIEIQKRDRLIDEYEIMSCKLETEKNHLNQFLKSDDRIDCEEMIAEVKNTIQELKNKLAEKSKNIKTHKDEIARLENLIQAKRNTPEDEILATVDPEKVDWMKISKAHFTGHSTWLDCQKAWENLVSPTINTGPWAKEEETKLLDLIKESAANDWKQIAKDLGTGRTAFQCFSHYQQKFNSALKPRPWSQEEDDTLVKVTNNVKDSVGFFNWAKVSTLVDSRSPLECMYRFTKVDPCQSRGRFTQLEDAKLLAAVEMIGPSWSKVAKFIGTRNMVQCRDRYLNCLAPNINFSHFTYDEDVKLLKLRKQHGQVWSKMVPEFSGRTDSMLLNRYRQLQRWKRQSEWFDRQTEATKRMLLGKSLTVSERRQFQARAEDYMKTQLGLGPEDYKRQELDKQNNVDPDIIPPRPPRHLRCYSFGTSRKGANLSKWSEKLDIHNRLTENVQKLLQKEILAGAGVHHKGEGRLAVSDEVAAEIVQKSAEETLKGNKFKPKIKTKAQLRQLEAALNRAFLTTGTVSVQEFLKLSTFEKKRARNLEKSNLIDAELKNILRTRGRYLSKQGRARRFFERDTRPRRVIEEELDECDQSAPLMIMKFLGTSTHSLCASARHHCLDHQEELANLPSYEEDPDFREEEAETQKAIQNLAARTDGTVSNRQMRILKKKLKSLRKIYQEKMYLNSKVVENKISAFNDDIEFLEALTDEKGQVNKNVSLMICNPPGISETAFDAELIEAGSEVLSATPSSDVQVTLPNSCVTQSQSPQQTTSGESTSSASKTDHKFAVPLAPPIKQRKIRSSRFLSDTNEPSKKVFKALSKEEIVTERKQLPSSKKKIFASLPLLPPSLSTLLGLRALFLMKDELKERTERIQRQRYEAAHPAEATTSPEILKQEDNSVGVDEDEPQVQDTASWFLNTDVDKLGEQARKFKPYGRLGKVSDTKPKHHFQTVGETMFPSASRTEDEDVAFEAGTFMYPLEERGGHLPSYVNKSTHVCDHDAKPVVSKSKKSPVKQSKAKPPSSYEVVLGVTGIHARECVPGGTAKKQTDKKSKSGSNHPSLTQVPTTRNNPPVVPVTLGNLSVVPVTVDNLSQIPAAVIKSEPPSTTVSYNIYNENDSERSRTFAGSSWGVSVQDSRPTRPDAVYSVHASGQSEHNIDDEDEDVVAVIHLDDDDSSLMPTVINLCSSQSDIVKTEIFDSKDDEGVIFSENVRPSQFMIIPPEPSAAEVRETTKANKMSEASELSSLKLPENCVNSIMRNKRLKHFKSRIVVVGVDEESKRIIHFKSEDDKFKAYEAIPTAVAEDCSGHRRGPRSFTPGENNNKVFSIAECMRGLRKTDEYKLLLARFRALFLWPVFMSTVKPNPLNDGPFPIKLRTLKPGSLKQKEMINAKNKKRLRSKMSAAKRHHLRLINECSRRVRSKKVPKVKTGKQVRGGRNVDGDGEINVECPVIAPTPDTEVSHGQKNVAVTQQAESCVGQGEVTMAVVKIEPNPSATIDWPGVGNEDSIETKFRRRKGRPRGSRNIKYEPIIRKRSQRIKDKFPKCPEEAPPAEPAKEVIKVLPQWWKDAVLAAMLAKKAITEGQEENIEVRIDEDDEFLDKGNYSDDEWYQQLCVEELEKAAQEQQKEIAIPDVTLASQDKAAEDKVLLE